MKVDSKIRHPTDDGQRGAMFIEGGRQLKVPVGERAGDIHVGSCLMGHLVSSTSTTTGKCILLPGRYTIDRSACFLYAFSH